MEHDEHLEAAAECQALAQEIRAEARRLGINLRTATDTQLVPLTLLLPEALIQDAKDIAKASGLSDSQYKLMLSHVIRIALLADDSKQLN